MAGKRFWDTIGKIVFYTVITIGAIIMVLPFYWMISSSLMTDAQIFRFPPRWFPPNPIWKNYKDVVEAFPFFKFIYNTFFISIMGTLGTLFTSMVAAYVFARMQFPFKKFIFGLLMATMMIPNQVVMIPVFLIMRQLGWINTFLPLIVPNWLGGAFGIFLIRQFYLTLPPDFEEAAAIDGYGRFGIIFRILAPMTKPALATLGVFTFMGKWNDLLGPIIYLNDLNKMTLTVGLAMFRGQYYTKYNYLMAGAVISVLPVVIIYFCAQRYFVEGIALTGIKG